MHEMALTEGVLSVLQDEARRQDFQRVKMVCLEIGALSHVDPDAMRFCFDAVMAGSLADGATLKIVETPGEAWCIRCSQSIAVATRHDACPDCGGYQLQVTGGDEMKIKELEVV